MAISTTKSLSSSLQILSIPIAARISTTKNQLSTHPLHLALLDERDPVVPQAVDEQRGRADPAVEDVVAVGPGHAGEDVAHVRGRRRPAAVVVAAVGMLTAPGRVEDGPLHAADEQGRQAGAQAAPARARVGRRRRQGRRAPARYQHELVHAARVLVGQGRREAATAERGA